ncbi:MAG TPA: Ldh family oxidoreductase [Candidatus Onthocola gallistercoris]|uniref:Ldh family oxidoreductase n=1 Tax=Candidatus Onthocola gallistercoris TaxID=2840876 RepID=A0A9D1KXN4_9FIRM|nr:Ldh family oxidoreductase [Candidatus Onthocola gallistercoris]
MAKTNIVDWETITNFVTDAFVGYGIPREDAEICTDVLLESDKRGIESHGVNRFKPIYLDRIKDGIQNPVTNYEIIKETPTTAVVDGHDGMGQVIGYKSMRMAIDKAKEYGMGMVVVRNSCHYGIAGYYASMASKEGCIGITGTNARPSVAPTFGVEGMFGTNPLTIGIPTDEPFDFLIDCATSITQNGKIEYYERIKKDVLPGTIIGLDGEPVEGDAGAALKMIRNGTAALTTLGGIGEALGGYKGYGYAMAIELLSAALQDGNYGKALDGKDADGNKVPYHLGHFFIAIDTDHFLGEDVCRKKAGEIIRTVRASKKAPGAERIYTAGEKEYLVRLARKDGVPINESVQKEMVQIRDELKLTQYKFPWED